MRRAAWLLACLALPAFAHTISMSHGLLRVEGDIATFQVRMPSYEMVHIAKPEQTLLSAIQFSSDGKAARILQRSCHEDTNIDAFICDVVYQFPGPPQSIHVACTLARATVPNHIHLLRAIRGTNSDQLIFDRSTEAGDLRFRPPTAFESAVRNTAAGAIRAVSSVYAILFLAVLAAAGRSWREFAAILTAFAGGEALSCSVLPFVRFDPSPRFIEIATMLAIAYLLLEILFLPRGSARWVVCGILGVLHGMYFYLLVRNGELNPVWVLVGAFLAQSAIAIPLFFALQRVIRIWSQRRRTTVVSPPANA